ncbi:iron uptake system protein EfeO [Thorsellia anophelis]|uniref:Imelysin n=1 Tax=Thorsellia anophelis DSM 18579 TaxID=1123402 RepID=A0A1I0ATU3_9GAMM|nr:iron uptake system protein EfeO [Thorsellia anophelis]SES97179.1 Imelysin [Thorsellia anophelis DSM 18579]
MKIKTKINQPVFNIATAIYISTLCVFPAISDVSTIQEQTINKQFDLPINQYKQFVINEMAELVKATEQFTTAIDTGDIELAKALYAPTRLHFERIEPVAELFGDLDPAIDAREDDFKLGAADPKFTGFHRLEKMIFSDNTLEGTKPFSDKLLKDVLQLNENIKKTEISPIVMVQGAADLLEEIALSKITGEEERYSKTDLWDFSGNLAGAYHIFDLLKPLITTHNADLVTNIDAQFSAINMTLGKYRVSETEGYQSYDSVSEQDLILMKAQITTLAEDLSTLRGILNLDDGL